MKFLKKGYTTTSWSIFILILSVFFLYQFFEYDFFHPHYFFLLFIIPVAGIFYLKNKEKLHTRINFSSSLFAWKKNKFYETMMLLPYQLKILSLFFLVMALARPQSEDNWENLETEGIDIIMAVDVSESMLAMDFKPNRLESAKRVAIDFIDKRPNDRIGLVIYEAESFTQTPLTIDHKVLKNLFREIQPGMLQGGTAIGLGIGSSINRLKQSKAKSKVVILLTDGVNNSGAISPITAAEIAKEYGIRIYAIGVGTQGEATTPVKTPSGQIRYVKVPVEIDEETLTKIANITGGVYFRATDEKGLEKIYKDIDYLERTKFKVTQHSKKSEHFLWYALLALFFTPLSYLLEKVVLKKVL